MKNYLNINDERAATEYYDQVYDIENYTELKASSSLIGIDLKELVKDNAKLLDFLIATLNVELEKKEGSVLLNQMIETHTGLQFDELYECIQIIVNQLKK